MILKIILNYILGFINITVEGFFVERFINDCLNNKIFLWSIKRESSTILNANVSIEDFKKIRKAAKKTKCKIKINYKKGVPIFLYKYRKRKILAVLLIPIVLMILISSRYVWNIEIVGTNKISKEELITQLNEEGVYIGNKKDNIDAKKIIENIRLKRNDISWMSMDMKGTNIIITVVESELKPEIIDKEKYCNIISNKKRCLVTKITADMGTTVVKKGDIVEEGDMLIAGCMEGKYTEKRYVHAKGSIEAKVWYTKKIKSNYTREIEQKTESQESRYSININKFKINLFKSLPNFENYDTINETKKIKLFSNFYLPIEINKTTYIEKNISKITYGKEELKQILIEEIQQQFSEEQIDKLNVLNKIINVYDNEEDKLEIEMTYEVMENIGVESEI